MIKCNDSTSIPESYNVLHTTCSIRGCKNKPESKLNIAVGYIDGKLEERIIEVCSEHLSIVNNGMIGNFSMSVMKTLDFINHKKIVTEIADQISLSIGEMTVWNIGETIANIHSLCDKLRGMCDDK